MKNLKEFFKKHLVSICFLVVLASIFAYAWFNNHQGFAKIKELLNELSQENTGYSILIMGVLTLVLVVSFSIVVSKVSAKSTGMTQVQKITIIGVFTALAYLLMFMGFPIIGGYEYLKVEVSFVVILLIAMVIDLESGIVVAAVTATIDYLIKGSFTGVPIDQIAYFIASIFMLNTAYFVNKIKMHKQANVNMALSLAIGVLVTTMGMVILNYLWVLPLYNKLMGFPLLSFWDVVKVFGFFNLVKWGAVGVVAALAYPAFNRIKEAIAQ